jgi:hypothetical protein
MTTYLSRLPCWLWVVDDIIHGCDVDEGQFAGARTKSEAVVNGAPRSEARGERRAKVTEETCEQSAREAESEEQINSWPSWCWTWWKRKGGGGARKCEQRFSQIAFSPAIWR